MYGVGRIDLRVSIDELHGMTIWKVVRDVAKIRRWFSWQVVIAFEFTFQ